jgi:uncharacterized protein DUF7029
MRIQLLTAVFTAITYAAPSPASPSTCPSRQIVYEYVYVDENGTPTGEITYQGPFDKSNGPSSPPPPEGSGGWDSWGTYTSPSLPAPTGSGYSGSAYNSNHSDTIHAKPHVPPGVWTSSPDQIKPQPGNQSQTVYYAGSDSSGINWIGVSANFTWQAPTVILDHCQYVATVYHNGQLIVTFSNSDAYELAKDHWNESIFLVTYAAGCGGSDVGEYCYFLAISFQFNDGSWTITCTGAAKSHEEAIDTFGIGWGHYVHKPWENKNQTSSGSGLPTNGTDSNDTYNVTDLCTPPVDIKYGLPTACLGPYFDEDIDEEIGFIDGNGTWASKVQQYLDDVSSDDQIDYQQLRKRGFDLKGWVKNTASNVGGAVGNAVDKSKQFVQTNVVDKGKVALQQVVQQAPIPYVTKDSTLTGGRTFPFKVPSSVNADKNAPWNNARLVKRYIPLLEKGLEGKVGPFSGSAEVSTWCVDCGVQGQVTTQGSITGSLLNGITGGDIDFTTDMAMSLYAGMQGNMSVAVTLPLELGTYPLGAAANFGGVVQIGLQVGLALEFVLKVGFEKAAILAGGTLGWKGSKMKINWQGKDQNSKMKVTTSGWTPEWKPLFNATGEFYGAAEIAFPVELLLGIQLVQKKDLEIGPAIEQRPAIELKGSYEGNFTSNGKSKSFTSTSDDCNGLKVNLDLKHELGAKFKLVSLTKKLYDFYEPKNFTLWKGCKDFNGTWATLQTAKDSLKGVFSKRQIDNGTYAYTNLTQTPTDPTTFLNTTDLYDITNQTDMYSTPVDFDFPGADLSAYNTTGGMEYTLLQDLTSGTMVAACGDGNMYLQMYESSTSLDTVGCGVLFAYDQQQDIAYADGSGRIPYYYADEMEKLGVSRLRLAAINEVPNNTMAVSFVPFYQENSDDSDDTSAQVIYLPSDANDNVFGTAVCTYKDTGKPPKIFAISDVDTSFDMLKSQDIVYSVTGGEIDDCYILSLGQGNQASDEAWDGDGNDEDFSLDWIDDYSDSEDMDIKTFEDSPNFGDPQEFDDGT